MAFMNYLAHCERGHSVEGGLILMLVPGQQPMTQYKVRRACSCCDKLIFSVPFKRLAAYRAAPKGVVCALVPCAPCALEL